LEPEPNRERLQLYKKDANLCGATTFLNQHTGTCTVSIEVTGTGTFFFIFFMIEIVAALATEEPHHLGGAVAIT
jgi:hypothetical protein